MPAFAGHTTQRADFPHCAPPFASRQSLWDLSAAPPSPTAGRAEHFKVGAQVKVEDPRLPLDYRLGNSLDRIMSSPLGTIYKRSRLEIRLEDRLEYELERALHHSVADRWNREDTDFAPVLRYLLPPRGKWLVGAPDQFVP
jgi:hypothetical protein